MSGKILGKRGIWPLVPAGLVVVLVGYAAMAFSARVDISVIFLVCVAIAYGGIGLIFPAIKSVDLESLPRKISSNGSAIHSTLVQIAGSISSALFVGMMSGRVDQLVSEGSSKAAAYAAGFDLTAFIAIGLLVVALVVSIFYVCAVGKKENTRPAVEEKMR